MPVWLSVGVPQKVICMSLMGIYTRDKEQEAEEEREIDRRMEGEKEFKRDTICAIELCRWPSPK